MAAAGELEAQPAADRGGGAEHEGREARVGARRGRGEHGLVEQLEQPDRVGLQPAQGVEGLPDLPGGDRGLDALAADVAEQERRRPGSGSTS